MKAAEEAEKAQFRLTQALDSAGASMKQRADSAALISKVSKQAALDDEDLSDVLARLVRSTGDVKEAQEGMALSAEIARGRNISLEAASKSVEKAYLGNATALKRLGIVVPEVTDAYGAVKKRIGELEDQLKRAEGPQKKQIEAAIESEKAQIRNAKALDKAATAQDAIAKAQEKFAGSSEKYGKTAAGAQERFQVAVENLQEAIGAHLLPILAKLSVKATEVIEWLEKHGPEIGRVFKTAADIAEKAIKPMLEGIKNIAEIVSDVIKTVDAIVHGKWGDAWDNFSDIPGKAIDLITKTMLKLPIEIGKLALEAGKAIVDKIGDGLAALPGVLLDGLVKAAQGLATLPTSLATAALGLGTAILGKIGEGLAGSIGGLGGLGEKIAGVLDGIGEEASAVFNAAKEVGGRVLTAIGKGFEGTISGIGGLGGKIKDILGGIGEQGSEVAGAAVDVGKRIFGKIIEGVSAVAGMGNAIFERVSTGVTNIMEDVKKVGGEIAGWIKGAIAASVGWGSAVLGAIAAGVKNILDDIVKLGSKIGSSLKAGIISAISGAAEWVINNVIAPIIRAYNAIPLVPNVSVPHAGAGAAPKEDDPGTGQGPGPPTQNEQKGGRDRTTQSTLGVPNPDDNSYYGGEYGTPGGKLMAAGGIVKARPGGILARIGEGGHDEAVIPLSRSGGGLGGGVVFNFYGTWQDDRRFEDAISEAIQRLARRNGGNAFNGWMTS